MSNAKKILILEDDPKTKDVYEKVLHSAGYQTDSITSNKDVADALKRHEQIDLILADIGLADGSFLDFMATKAGQETCQGVPILTISAFEDTEILRLAYKLGVVDYIVKPFPPAELLVKVERSLEKAASKTTVVNTEFADLDTSSHTIRNAFGEVSLTSREFQIVSCFFGAKKFSLTKEEIANQVWFDTTVSGKSIEVYFARIRKKLQPLKLMIVYEAPNNYSLKKQ